MFTVYDQRSQYERTKCTLHYLNQSAVNAIVDDTRPGTSDSGEHEEEDLSGEEGDPPAPGEICALIPMDTCTTSAEIFLAKGLKYSSDGQTVRLACLQLVGKPNHHKFQVGHSIWEEKGSESDLPTRRLL